MSENTKKELVKFEIKSNRRLDLDTDKFLRNLSIIICGVFEIVFICLFVISIVNASPFWISTVLLVLIMILLMSIFLLNNKTRKVLLDYFTRISQSPEEREGYRELSDEQNAKNRKIRTFAQIIVFIAFTLSTIMFIVFILS